MTRRDIVGQEPETSSKSRGTAWHARGTKWHGILTALILPRKSFQGSAEAQYGHKPFRMNGLWPVQRSLRQVCRK